MNLFTLADEQQFNQKVKAFEGLMKSEGLSLEEVQKKKSYVKICSIKVDNANFKYTDLANLLNVIKKYG